MSLASTPLPSAPASRPPPSSDLREAILLAVLYADLFDFPLTEHELYERLVQGETDRTTFAAGLAALVAGPLAATQGFITWRGREHLVALRRHRQGQARALWPAAQRYARWLARVPFVRMVAVSGSLAVHNAKGASDIDFFCITEARRLWVTRLWIVPLSKLTRRLPALFPHYLCPNYLLALDALELEDRNLFTAHEVTQATPVWGHDVYVRFLEANRWTTGYLPQRRPDECLAPAPGARPPRLTRWLERLLRGRAGDVLDQSAHRLFVAFYRRRARRNGWSWPRLAQAYQRSRYTVPEGGYAPVVRACLLQRVRERLAVADPASVVGRLFPSPPVMPPPCYDWTGLFLKDYGCAAHDTLAPAAAGGTPPRPAPA